MGSEVWDSMCVSDKDEVPTDGTLSAIAALVKVHTRAQRHTQESSDSMMIILRVDTNVDMCIWSKVLSTTASIKWRFSHYLRLKFILQEMYV